MAKKAKPDQSKKFADFLKHRYSQPGTHYELVDAFTGEAVEVAAANHYEHNDGVPFAPPIEMPRLTLRERVQRLQGAGVDLDRYVPDESEDNDFSDPDDLEPLTHAEAAYVALNDHLDHLAEQKVAPQAPSSPTPAPAAPAEPAAEVAGVQGGAAPPAKGGS